MLVEPDGTFLSQRSLPAMASLRAVLGDGDALRLSGHGAPDLEIPVQYDGKRRDVSLFGKWFGQGVVQDPAADEWFTERLGKPAALVRVTPEHERPGWGVHRGQTGFGDAHALMITSLSSLDGLNERIVERGGDADPDEPLPAEHRRLRLVRAAHRGQGAADVRGRGRDRVRRPRDPLRGTDGRPGDRREDVVPSRPGRWRRTGGSPTTAAASASA